MLQMYEILAHLSIVLVTFFSKKGGFLVINHNYFFEYQTYKQIYLSKYLALRLGSQQLALGRKLGAKIKMQTGGFGAYRILLCLC